MRFFFDEDFIDFSNERNTNPTIENQPLSNNLSCEECLELGKVIYSINKEYSYDNFSKKLHILPMQSTAESCNHINFAQAADKLIEENNVYFCIDKIGFVGSINCSEEFIISNESDFKKILKIAKHMNDSFKLEIVMIPYKSDKLADINIKYDDIFEEKKEENLDIKAIESETNLIDQEIDQGLTEKLKLPTDSLIDSIYKLTQHTLCLTKKMNFLDLKLENIETSFDENTKPEEYDYWCDNCDCLILGTRYKCFSCLDYDLCEQCEKIEGIHLINHNFIKVKYPISYKKWKKLFFALMKIQSQNNSEDILNDPETTDTLSTNPFYQPIQIPKNIKNENNLTALITQTQNENPFLETNRLINPLHESNESSFFNDFNLEFNRKLKLEKNPKTSLQEENLESSKKNHIKKSSSALNKDLKKSIDLHVENSIKKFFKKHKNLLIKEQEEKNSTKSKQQKENQILKHECSCPNHECGFRCSMKYTIPEKDSVMKPLNQVNKLEKNKEVSKNLNSEEVFSKNVSLEHKTIKKQNSEKPEVLDPLSICSNCEQEQELSYIPPIHLEKNQELFNVVLKMTKDQYAFYRYYENLIIKNQESVKRLAKNTSSKKIELKFKNESSDLTDTETNYLNEEEIEEAFKCYDKCHEEILEQARKKRELRIKANNEAFKNMFKRKSKPAFEHYDYLAKNYSNQPVLLPSYEESFQAVSNIKNRLFCKQKNKDYSASEFRLFENEGTKIYQNEETKLSENEETKPFKNEETKPFENEETKPSENEVTKLSGNKETKFFNNEKFFNYEENELFGVKEIESVEYEEIKSSNNLESNILDNVEINTFENIEMVKDDLKTLDLNFSSKENFFEDDFSKSKLEENIESEIPQSLQIDNTSNDPFFNIKLDNSGRSSPVSESSSSLSSYEMVMSDSFNFDLEKNFEGLNISKSDFVEEKSKEINISTNLIPNEIELACTLEKLEVSNDNQFFNDFDKKEKIDSDEKMTSSKTSIYKSLIEQSYDEIKPTTSVKDKNLNFFDFKNWTYVLNESSFANNYDRKTKSFTLGENKNQKTPDELMNEFFDFCKQKNNTNLK